MRSVADYDDRTKNRKKTPKSPEYELIPYFLHPENYVGLLVIQELSAREYLVADDRQVLE